MNRIRIRALLCAALFLLTLLCGASAEVLENPPFVAEIDHYVVKLDATAYVTEAEIDCYRRLMDGIFAREPLVSLTESYDSNLNVLSLALNNPYRFLVKKASFVDDHTAVRLAYAYSEEEQRAIVDYIDGEYLDMFAEILELDMTDLEKTLAVHHYFAERITYDYAYVEGLNRSDEKFSYPEIEIYQALKTGKGVCHSYTYLCEFALQQLVIDCLRLTAAIEDSDDAHMWLAVRLDGEWYHVDPTWDSDNGRVSLISFGMTDAERLEGGIADNWNVEVDTGFGPIHAESQRFASLHDICDYRMLGGHKMEVWRAGVEHSEIVDLRLL